ncbi:MAG: hypothetical protein AB7E51_18745 [Pseudodesulfovibrio sp.]|uniref:hypothetical protein n=1 Tax=Pseudodesulfovibrio sp. TaxID=2035812 RepID=UPI003D0F6F1E
MILTYRVYAAVKAPLEKSTSDPLSQASVRREPLFEGFALKGAPGGGAGWGGSGLGISRELLFEGFALKGAPGVERVLFGGLVPVGGFRGGEGEGLSYFQLVEGEVGKDVPGLIFAIHGIEKNMPRSDYEHFN